MNMRDIKKFGSRLYKMGMILYPRSGNKKLGPDNVCGSMLYKMGMILYPRSGNKS